MRRRRSYCTVALVVVLAGNVDAQAAAPSCAERLNTPTRDSVTLEVEVIARAFDPSQRLPDSYSRLIGEGVRQFFHPTSALTLDTYAGGVHNAKSPALTHLMISTSYRATLHGDGRITDARVGGGMRTNAFDEAMLGAIKALDSSNALPPVHDTIAAELIPLVIQVKTFSDRDQVIVGPFAKLGVPLFSYRTPARAAFADAAQLPGTSHLRYPQDMRAKDIEGEVVMSFVVQADGTADVRTLQVERATHDGFIGAVVDAIPGMRFYPMEVEKGCPVRSLVQQPYTFVLHSP